MRWALPRVAVLGGFRRLAHGGDAPNGTAEGRAVLGHDSGSMNAPDAVLRASLCVLGWSLVEATPVQAVDTLEGAGAARGGTEVGPDRYRGYNAEKWC